MRTQPLTASRLQLSCCPPSFPHTHTCSVPPNSSHQDNRASSPTSPRGSVMPLSSPSLSFSPWGRLSSLRATLNLFASQCPLRMPHCQPAAQPPSDVLGALPSCPDCRAEQSSTAGRLPIPQVPSFPGHSFRSILARHKSWLQPIPPPGVNAAGAVERLPAPALWLRLPSADLRGRESSSQHVLPPTQVALG